MRIFALLIFSLLSRMLVADGFSGYHSSSTDVYAFRFDGAELTDPDNYFVKEIARINYLNLRQTAYRVEYRQDVEVQPAAGGGYLLRSRIAPVNIDGDVYYKRFNLADVLTPALCSYEVVALDGDRELRRMKIADQAVGEFAAVPFKTDEATSGNLRLEIDHLHFAYLDENKTAFSRRISAINDYLAYLELNKLFIEKAGRINPDATTGLLSTFLGIYDINRFWEMLCEGTAKPDFEVPTVYLNELDAGKKSLNSVMRRINTLFGRNTDTLAMTPSAADYHQAAQHLTNLQLDYFSAIKKTYYYFEPVYLKAAGFFESPDGWQKLSGAIDAALGKTLTGNSVSSLTPQLCNTLYQTYLRTGDSLIAGQNYNEALLILRNAEVLCANLRGTDCSLALYNRLSQATYGIYDAYLRVARSAMEARNLDMAGRYLLRAMDFQLQNSSLIITAGDADKLFEDLAWQYFEQGRELSRNEDRDQALAAFISARDIYTRLGISTFDEALKYEIEKLQRQ